MNCLFCKQKSIIIENYIGLYWCENCFFEFNSNGGTLYVNYNKSCFDEKTIKNTNYINIYKKYYIFILNGNISQILNDRLLTKQEYNAIFVNKNTPSIYIKERLIKEWMSYYKTMLLK